MPRQKFVSVQLTPQVRESARLLALTLSAQVGRRLSLASAIDAAITVANEYPEALASAVRDEPED